MTTGRFAFLFTDVARSTRLWEEAPSAMEVALADHDSLLRAAVRRNAGEVFSTMGDGIAAAFSNADDAIKAAVAAQRSLIEHAWGETGPFHVRMAVHVGEAQRRDGDYFGPTLNRCARLMAVAHGGQILLSSAARGSWASDGTDLKDLGVHRLRDLSEPEHIFQVLGAGLPADFPPLLSLEGTPGNLPLQPTSFLGRAAEVAATIDDLSRHRLVTLTGAGGVGKTRLALQVAGEVAPRFSGGTWLCELAPVGDPEAVPHALASALGAASEAGRGILEALVARLANSATLVVLDNCEHLIDAVGSLVEAIIHRSPGVTFLATSREPLAVEGEKIRPVRPLDATAAALLFTDRAGAIRDDLPAEEGAVRDICTRLDGVPLAIELAAARVASMTAVEIAARLDERFRLLTGGRRTAMERHRTLRGTVDWSFQLLVPAEQRVFDRLSVFAGGFTLEAAEQVAADPDIAVLDALQSLVQKSMVVAEPVSGGRHYRYSMLETIRHYAAEHLADAGEADSARMRHLEYFCRLAEEGECGEQGADETEWAARLDSELANFRAALSWAIASGSVAQGARIVGALYMHAFFHQWSEFDGWATTIADALEGSAEVDEELAARAEAVGAGLAWGAGDNNRARRLIERAYSRHPRDGLTETLLLFAEASVELTRGNVTAAVEADRAAVEAAQRCGAVWWTVMSTAHLVMSLAASGDTAGAIATAREAVAGARRLGSCTAIAFSSFTLADTLIDQDVDEAVSLLEAANAAGTSANLSFIIGLTRGSLVTAQGRFSDPRRAVDGYLELLEHWQTAGNIAHLRGILRNAAEMMTRLGHPEVTATVYGAMQTYGSLPPAGSPEAQRLEASLAQAEADLADGFAVAVDRGRQLTDQELVQVVRSALASCRSAQEA